jgi:branched-chain amino acid transport system permease protein
MFDLTSLLPRIVNGLTFAGLLFVLASGFTLVFGLMRIVSMSHGVFYILGAYLAYTVQKNHGTWVEGVLAATIGVGLLSLLSYFLVRRVKGDLPQTLLTLGIGTVVGDLILWIWGGNPKSLNAPELIGSPVTIAGFTYPGYRYFVLLVAIIIGVGLWYLLQRTQLGRIIRAGVDNRVMVSALGINIDRIFAQVYVLGGLITGFAGALGGTFMAFGPGKDLEILTFALVVVIIGGLGSVPGTAAGAVIVGLVDSFGRSYFNELAIFLLSGTLILVLAFKPKGLFGKGER